MEKVDNYKFKVCVLGDPSVGKTSLIHHYCKGFFEELYLSTIGVEFLTRDFELKLEDGTLTKAVLQLWDIGGQSLFQSIRSNYIKGSNGAFILFDVTNKSSLIHIDDWITELMHSLELDDLLKIPLLIIGNKIDLNFDDGLKERANRFIKNQYNYPIPIIYTSAKTGNGMKEAFNLISKKMIKEVRKNKNK